MSSILVVERETQDQERIQDALRAEGWKVRVVAGADQALQAAAAESPDLVVVSAEVPGVEALASSFSRNAGGPGVLGLLPALAAGAGVGAIEADDLLAKPFTDDELRETVRRALAARRQAPAAAAAASLFEAPNQKLTSQDIFGDVLAEMEEEMPQTTFAPPPRPAARPVATPAAASPPVAPAAPPRPAAPPPAAPAPAPRSAATAARQDDEIQRKLEQTLSGVLGTAAEMKPRPAAPAPPAPAAAPPAAPRRPPTPSESEVDALLSKTLGNIDLGPRSRPAAPPAAPRSVSNEFPNVGATQPMQIPSSLWSEPGAPAAPPAAEPVRKSGRTGEIDLSQLEELARPTRRPEPERPAAPPASLPAAPTVAVPFPGSPGATSLPISQAEEAEMLFDLAPELPEPPPLPLEEPAPVPAASAAPAAPPAEDAPPRNLSFDGSATQWIPIVPKEEGGEPGLRFGQYTLLERIAVGGMAELWKARMRGVEGFQKTVAIKKILPHMTDNSEFIDMFVDEAKLAAQLSHPNIVHIYDLGRINRDYYIAMEYVDGKDLRSLLNAARRRNLPLSPGLALLIAARLAGALDYAHRMRDFEGKEMNLVHRDVSPQNVLLTYEGDVKLCDFGIAKAVSKASHTQMGALKGKLQYMSPEQAWGRPVDSRSDIFSLGAVLFEMLTGERLFSGDSEMSVLEAVRQARIRLPREIDPALPAEADEIVARALAVEPQSRFASAGEMGQRIEALLRHMTPTPTHSDLAAYIRQVLSEEPVQEEGEVSFVTAPPAPAPAPPASPAPAPAMVYEPAVVPPPMEIPPYPAYPAPEGAPVEPVAPLGEVEMAEVDGSRKGRGLLYAAIVFLILAAILTFVLLSRRGAARPEAEPAGPTPAAPAPASAEPSAAAPDLAATQPAAAPAKPAIDKAQVDAMFDREMAKRTEALRRQYEEKERQIKREIEKNRAAARAKAPPRESAAPIPATGPESQPEPSRPPASLSAW